MKTRAIHAVLITALCLLLMAVHDGYTAEVKYCYNPFTQETITVLANQPCPYPFHEI